jgi:hypothetical protein
VGKMNEEAIRKLQQRKEAHDQKELEERKREELKRGKARKLLYSSLDQVIEIANDAVRPYLLREDDIVLWWASCNVKIGIDGINGLYYGTNGEVDSRWYNGRMIKENNDYFYTRKDGRKNILPCDADHIPKDLPKLMLDSLQKGIERLVAYE